MKYLSQLIGYTVIAKVGFSTKQTVKGKITRASIHKDRIVFDLDCNRFVYPYQITEMHK